MYFLEVFFRIFRAIEAVIDPVVPLADRETREEGSALPDRAVVVHRGLTSNDGGMLSGAEHHAQGKSGGQAKKDLAELNALMNTASSLLLEVLGYWVVDRQAALRAPRPQRQALSACAVVILELSDRLR
jgi:hypothetical protein